MLWFFLLFVSVFILFSLHFSKVLLASGLQTISTFPCAWRMASHCPCSQGSGPRSATLVLAPVWVCELWVHKAMCTVALSSPCSNDANAHTAETWADCSDEQTNNTGFWIQSQPAEVQEKYYLLAKIQAAAIWWQLHLGGKKVIHSSCIRSLFKRNTITFELLSNEIIELTWDSTLGKAMDESCQ